MSLRQWEIWKCKPDGFERDHWFVVLSSQEAWLASRFEAVSVKKKLDSTALMALMRQQFASAILFSRCQKQNCIRH